MESSGPLDFVRPLRPVSMRLVGGRGHYEAIVQSVIAAKVSVWIATANLKEMLVEDSRAAPGRRRTMRASRAYRSILQSFSELARAGVELRILHAGPPSRAFRDELDRNPELIAGGLQLRVCPRVHLKTVIIDGAELYLGSANWTGAGLGAKGEGRRNFELGLLTSDGQLIDEVQSLYDRIWRGAECGRCRLRAECPGPLDIPLAGIALPAPVQPRPIGEKTLRKKTRKQGEQRIRRI